MAPMPITITPAMRGQRGRRNAGMMRGAAARAFAARTKGPGPASTGLCLNGTSTIVARRDRRTTTMREALLLLYCTVVGYVASGITASFFRLITAQPARFGSLG